MKSMIGAIAACALALAGCGDNSPRRAFCGDLVCELDETASSCAEDCGCGNGVANLEEDCDGTDLGTATCESVVQRGGTLSCNADCTFDVDRCDEYMCGNGVVEPGEDCDGTDVAGATCASAGFSAGAVGCTSSCTFDVTACCNDFCETANTSTCAGETVETCVMQTNGCLGLQITDCAADDDVCDDTSGTATCMCVNRCSVEGLGHCAGAVAETCEMQADGCLAYTTNSDCATTGDACAVGPQGSTCVSAASGEDCADPYPLHDGLNVIGWSATLSDYLTSTTQTSCNSTTFLGPDVVLAFNATADGIVTYTMNKQVSQRHVLVVSSAACGTVTSTTDISCISDFSATTMSDTFSVTQGTTYYFYVQDTNSGSAPLPSPLILNLDVTACATFVNNASNLSPANGAVLSTTNPVLTFDLQHPVNQDVGVITITGSLGTNRSYDLATNPSQVTFTNGGRTVRIDPTVSFLPGETITVSWSGVVDQFCGATIAPPTWTFSILTPSCTPGMGGMVGTTVTRVATGIASFTERYVALDADPAGYVYVGGTSDLFRMPKAGGAVENVVALSGMSTTPLGDSMAIVGSRVFSLDTTTSATSPFLWRLTTSGGVTWNPLGYAQWAMTAGGTPRAMVEYNGRLYIVTDETTTGQPTEIWSVSTSLVTLPAPPVLEGSFTTEIDCDGLAVDDRFFYLTCDNSNDHLVRVNRTTFQTEVITTAIPLSASKNDLHAHDLNSDGVADVLYIKTEDESVRYVCAPAGTAPFWADILATFGSTTTTGNQGLGFDRAANVLCAIDDDTRELIKIQ